MPDQPRGELVWPISNLERMVFDATEADFEQRVIERSREVPVVVDFWAEWCGPCRTLTPVLEAEAAKREGEVELAKVDTDANQQLAAAFGIQGIPAVKAFKDGQVADEFTGALPPARVAEFFDRLVPSEADRLAEADDEASLRRALELDPKNAQAAVKLGRLLVERGDTDDAVELLDGITGDFVAQGLVARAKLQSSGDGAAPVSDDLQPRLRRLGRRRSRGGARGAPGGVRGGRRSRPARRDSQGDGRDLHRARNVRSARAGAPAAPRRSP